jgi:hypothetical protein
MRRCLRIFWLLLCLVLAARGSAAAVLQVTAARWHNHPVAEGGALVGQAPLAGLHDGIATQAIPERAAIDGSSQAVSPQPHHHSCHHLCTLVAAVSAPMSVPVVSHTSVPVLARQDFSSVISSPPVPPPRVRSTTD